MDKMIQRSITVSKDIDNWVKEYASKYGLKVSQAYRMLVVKARDAENATETLTGLVEQLSTMQPQKRTIIRNLPSSEEILKNVPDLDEDITE